MQTTSYVGQGPLNHDNHFVYILKCSDGSLYTGCTQNLSERLERHRKGYVISTKYRLPVEIITYIVFSNKYKAYDFEKYLKTGSGRAFVNKRFV
ncbi:GIY-YIG nuclease family protein [Saccharicrinis sp. FJH2]|uniref:GIY-YIG nuclease family protein n=1 Tax=Saccharicrinis sp. FJH65 TaxID=3344659 RepID=UPI0035F36111